jgi:hypothetical protein
MVTGNTVIAGTLSANGGISVDTNKFTVADTTGNSVIAGTLGVTGATTLTGLLTVNNNITAGANTITAANFTGQASASSAIRTVSRSTNASHFITFVNSNNGTAANESLFTDAGLFYNPSTNALSVTGDIIAFASDERLKENIQPLENALDKVLALSGFTYTFNEIGESLGFDTTITYVGVSAQQVQAVLPEAVKPAPANEDYLTVQYEKIVPLLIEAIKELKAEIDELKKINN